LFGIAGVEHAGHGGLANGHGQFLRAQSLA
jgi:hypothetical protein